MDGTAIAGADYDGVDASNPSSITIGAGQKTGYLPLVVHGQNIAEPDENFQVQLLSATLVSTTDGSSGHETVSSTAGTVTVHDTNSHQLLVSVTPLSPAIPEGNGSQNASFVASISTAVEHDVTVHYSYQTVSNGMTIDSKQDVTATIPSGQTSATFTVPYTGDTLPGHDQTVSVHLISAGPAAPFPGFTVNLDPVASHQNAAVTVLDDDATITVTSPVPTNEGNSGTTDFVFPVHLSAPLDHDVVIAYHTVDGTAVSSGPFKDFIGQPAGTVTIKAGQQDASIHVAVVGDTLTGGDEMFKVQVDSVAGAHALDSAQSSFTATIKNDDGSSIARIADAPPVAEGANAAFTVSLDHASEDPVTLTYKVVASPAGPSRLTTTTAQDNGTATVVIPAGQTQATILVPVTTDSNTDSQTTFSVVLQGVVGNPVVSLDSAHHTGAGTILPANLPVLSIAGATQAEGNTGQSPVETFRVTLSHTATVDETFTVDTINGTAIGSMAVGGADGDFSKVHQQYTISKGQTFIDVPVTLHGNNAQTPDKTFQVQLSLSGDATLDDATLGIKTATGVIQNDKSLFSISGTGDNSTANVSVTEGAAGQKFATFQVSRTNSTLAATVQYTAVAGTADIMKDFLPAGGTLSFAAGQSSVTISVPIVDDQVHESDETFKVVLSNPTNAILGAQSAGTVTIHDNDAAPFANLNNVTVKEGNSGTTAMVFTVSLDRASEVVFAAIPADPKIPGSGSGGPYVAAVHLSTVGLSAAQGTLANDVVYFHPGGPLQQTVTVNISGNHTQNEPRSTFELNIASVTGATAGNNGKGTIIDDDPAPVVSISSVSTAQGMDEVFKVTLSNPSIRPIDVLYYTQDGTALSGHEYAGVPKTSPHMITIPAGMTSADLPVHTTASTGIAGPDETFQVHLVSAKDELSGQQKPLPVSFNPQHSTATGTIVNVTTEEVSINDVSVVEGNSGVQTATFTVSLAAPSSVPVTVHYATADGTATVSGQDYLPKSGTVVIPAGHTQADVAVQVRGDLLQEADETFTVTLSGAQHAAIGRATGTGTITNDDSTPTLNLNDAYAVEGGNLVFTPTLSSVSTSDVTFTLSTAAIAGIAQAATPGADYTTASASFTIKAGDLTPKDAQGNVLTFAVAAKTDSLFEMAENFSVKVSNLKSASPVLLDHGTATGTILDTNVLISGQTAKWIDVDGDLVTLQVSHGTLAAKDFIFSDLNSLGGRTLNYFNIANGGQQFLFADISIIATAQPGLPAALAKMGDGLVNVGSIQSNNIASGGNLLQLQGFDLGRVTVDGNLDQINAGDLFNDVGLQSLQVQSFGSGAVLQPGPGASGTPILSQVVNGIGTFSVKHDFRGELSVIGAGFGSIQSLQIGGALQGGALTDSGVVSCTGTLVSARIGSIMGSTGSGSGTITAGRIGALNVLGDIDNTGGYGHNAVGDLPWSGSVLANHIGTVKIGGSIIGGSVRAQNDLGSIVVAHDLLSAPGLFSPNEAVISAGGLPNAPALQSVTIHGQVNGGQILAGYGTNGNPLAGGASIGKVQIDGNVQSFDLVAGVMPDAAGGPDPYYGNAGDALISPQNSVISKIASVIIGGSIVVDPAGHTHAIEAQEIDAVNHRRRCPAAHRQQGCADAESGRAGLYHPRNLNGRRRLLPPIFFLARTRRISMLPTCGYSLVVKRQPSKLARRVRFPLPALSFPGGKDLRRAWLIRYLPCRSPSPHAFFPVQAGLVSGPLAGWRQHPPVRAGCRWVFRKRCFRNKWRIFRRDGSLSPAPTRARALPPVHPRPLSERRPPRLALPPPPSARRRPPPPHPICRDRPHPGSTGITPTFNTPGFTTPSATGVPSATSGLGGSTGTPIPAQAPSFTAPGGYGQAAQTFTPGEGRLARPHFEYSGALSTGFDDNTFSTPFNALGQAEVTQSVQTQAARPAFLTVVPVSVPRGGGPGKPRPYKFVLVPAQAAVFQDVVVSPAVAPPKVEASFVTRANASYGVQFSSRRTVFTMDLLGSASYYPERSRQKEEYNGSLALVYLHRITPRLQFSATANLAYLSQPDLTRVNAPTANSGDYFNANSKFDLSYRWSPRFSTVTTLSINSQLFTQQSATTGNFYEAILGTEARYLMTPRLTVLGEIRYGQTLYANDSTLDSQTVFLLIGGEVTLSRKLFASVHAGQELRTFNQGGSSRTSPYAETNLSFRYSRTGVVSWNTRVGFESPPGPNTTSQVFRSSINAVQAFSARTRGTLGFSAVHRINTDNNSTPPFRITLSTSTLALLIRSRSTPHSLPTTLF